MVEGGGSDDFALKPCCISARNCCTILQVNTKAVTDYLNAQIKAGAQAVQILIQGGMLSSNAYENSRSPICAKSCLA